MPRIATTCTLKQLAKKGNTRVASGDNATIIKLYKTEIVVYWPKLGKLILNTGGWHTPTTFRRINEALLALGITQNGKANWAGRLTFLGRDTVTLDVEADETLGVLIAWERHPLGAAVQS